MMRIKWKAVVVAGLGVASAVSRPALAAPFLGGQSHAPSLGHLSQPNEAARARDVSSILDPIRQKHNLPALAAVVVEGDRIVAQGVVGVRAQGSPDLATIDDQWHIGSCTKSMTATLAALLVERGTLKWTTTLGESFPELVPSMDAAWKDVTLEQLLTNRSGAPAGLDADGLWGRLWSFQGTPTEARLALVAGVVQHPPEAPPGSKFIYSNAGFSIAGAMEERATGRTWEDLMREMVFTPLGMSSAGFGAPGETASDGRIDQPRGHRAGPVAVEPGPGSDNPVAIAPAGLVHLSLPDWAKYASFHIHGERGDLPADFPLRLSAESFKRLHTPAGPDAKPDDGYAMGWGITRREWGGRVLNHNGSNTMWFAVIWLAPEKNFAVLVASNIGGDEAQAGTDQAAGALIQDYLAHASRPEK
jgi:CubicO group peptidase (beta-lactamase class C family)